MDVSVEAVELNRVDAIEGDWIVREFVRSLWRLKFCSHWLEVAGNWSNLSKDVKWTIISGQPSFEGCLQFVWLCLNDSKLKWTNIFLASLRAWCGSNKISLFLKIRSDFPFKAQTRVCVFSETLGLGVEIHGTSMVRQKGLEGNGMFPASKTQVDCKVSVFAKFADDSQVKIIYFSKSVCRSFLLQQSLS